MNTTKQSDVQIATRVLATRLLGAMRLRKKNPVHPYDGRPTDITIKINRKFMELKVWYGPIDWAVAAYVSRDAGSIFKARGSRPGDHIGSVLAEDYGVSAFLGDKPLYS